MLGVRDPPPPRRLKDVDERDRGHGEEEQAEIRLACRVPDRVHIGVPKRQPEEQEADRHAHEEAEQRRPSHRLLRRRLRFGSALDGHAVDTRPPR